MKKTSILERLPTDVLIQVLDYLDQHSQFQMCLASKPLSETCIRTMWHTPTCTTVTAFNALMSTIGTRDCNLYYPYKSFIVGLCLSFHTPQTVLVLNTILPAISLKKIWIENVQSISQTFVDKILCISDKLYMVHFSKCTSDTLTTFFTVLKRYGPHQGIEKIMICDCSVADQIVYQMVVATPMLQHFEYYRSGIISDCAIKLIVEHCRFIQVLIFTLPLNIVQANTVTYESLELLTQSKYLKVLICKGQVRISRKEYKNWLYRCLPSLEYCDLSFDL